MRILLDARASSTQDGDKSPNSARILPHHGRFCFAMICVTKFWHIGDHAVDSPLTWRVGIHSDEHTRQLIATILAPNVGPAQEETLLCRQSISRLRFFPGKNAHQSDIGDAHTAV